MEVIDTAIDAAALRALDAKTTGTITATAMTTLTGSREDIAAVLASTQITTKTGPDVIALTETDGITALQANALNSEAEVGEITATITDGGMWLLNALEASSALLTRTP